MGLFSTLFGLKRSAALRRAHRHIRPRPVLPASSFADTGGGRGAAGRSRGETFVDIDHRQVSGDDHAEDDRATLGKIALAHHRRPILLTAGAKRYGRHAIRNSGRPEVGFTSLP